MTTAVKTLTTKKGKITLKALKKIALRFSMIEIKIYKMTCTVNNKCKKTPLQMKAK